MNFEKPVDTNIARVENHRKHVTAGAVGECYRTTMCGLSVASPLPVRRICAWKLAFDNVNSKVINEMTSMAKACLSKTGTMVSRNSKHFLDQTSKSYFCNCAELTFSRVSSLSLEEKVEERHSDGLMSILHMGLTLYGRRYVAMYDKDGRVRRIFNEPGSIYLGTLTGAEHQVCHTEAAPLELLEVPSLGNLSSTVMMRSSLFPHDYKFSKRATPDDDFLCVARSFVRSISQAKFQLPTLHDCEEAFAQLYVDSTTSCPVSSASRLKRAAGCSHGQGSTKRLRCKTRLNDVQ